jgi:sirohydrochlorin ferrochelatase
MTDDALVLIGREGTQDRETLRTHAARLERRDVVDDALVASYAEEPVRELRDRLGTIEADRAFVLPACVAHSHETVDAVPAALPYLDCEVRYCDPIGRDPVLTDLLLERAAGQLETREGATLVLVGLGSSSLPYHRRTAECHAARVRERSDYGAVVTCYLLQNPAVECARYNVPTDRAVAVPLFLTHNETTDERIPAKLELDRGGIAYAAPFGEDRRVTDAIRGEVARQRALAGGDEDADDSSAFEGPSAERRRPLATDGEGAYR